MPTTPFGINFKGIFASALGSKMPNATLRQRAPAAVDVNNPTAGPAYTETPYPCRAVGQKYATTTPDGDVRTSTFQAIVFLGTLPVGIVPNVGDIINMLTPFSTVAQDATVITVEEIDPAGAVAVLGMRA